MRLRRMLGIGALTLALVGVSAGSALADGGTSPRKPVGKAPLAGLLAGWGGTAAGAQGFTCQKAKARLAQLNRGIAIVSTRIANGTARHPKLAARLVKLAERRATKIGERIAANCGGAASATRG